MTKEQLREEFCIWYYAQSQPLDANKVFEWLHSKLEQEIAELKDKSNNLKAAMIRLKHEELSAKAEIESITERLEAAEEVIAKVKPHLTVYASGYFLDNNTEVVDVIEKYQSLKEQAK